MVKVSILYAAQALTMMPYHRTALSLLLLQYSSSTTTTAFQATSFSNRQQKRRYIITSTSSSSSRRTFPSSELYTASINNNKAEEETLIESILDDGHGHINSNLAQAIYEWEVAQKFIVGHQSKTQTTAGGGQEDLFSTRDGLRLGKLLLVNREKVVSLFYNPSICLKRALVLHAGDSLEESHRVYFAYDFSSSLTKIMPTKPCITKINQRFPPPPFASCLS